MLTSEGEGEWEAHVERLYEAVGREDELARALGAFRPLFGAKSVAYLTMADARRPHSAFVGAQGITPQALVEYHSHFGAHDEWSKAMSARGGFAVGATVRGSALTPSPVLQSSYFGREFLARHDVGDILSTVVETASDSRPATVLTFHRALDAPPFDDGDVPRLAALAPHLRRVLKLHRRLAPQLAVGATLAELFHAAEVPMMFLARDGRVLDHNLAARAAFEAPEPLLARRAGRLIGAVTGGGWHELGALLGRLDGQPAFSLEVVAGTSAATLEVRRVLGATTELIAEHEVLAICSLRPARPLAAAALRGRFRLTPMETRIAEALCGGQAPNQIAAALGVRISTVRTHIRALFSKTGARRLAELVAILHGSPVPPMPRVRP
jgi:DNA-binding CsgD family transcriptional regulator